MAKRFIEESTLTDIADAIREKKGSSELLDPAEFASEVRGITGGSNVNGILKEYTVDAGETISAGDFIKFVKRSDTFLANPTSEMEAIRIGSTTVLIVYRDEEDGGKGKITCFDFESGVPRTTTKVFEIDTVSDMHAVVPSEGKLFILYKTTSYPFNIALIDTSTLQVVDKLVEDRNIGYYTASYLSTDEVFITFSNIVNSSTDASSGDVYSVEGGRIQVRNGVSVSGVETAYTFYVHVMSEDRALCLCRKKYDYEWRVGACIVDTTEFGSTVKPLSELIDFEVNHVMGLLPFGDGKMIAFMLRYDAEGRYTVALTLSVTETDVAVDTYLGRIGVDDGLCRGTVVQLDEGKFLLVRLFYGGTVTARVILKNAEGGIDIGNSLTVADGAIWDNYANVSVIPISATSAVILSPSGESSYVSINGTNVSKAEPPIPRGTFAKKAPEKYNAGIAQSSGSEGDLIPVYSVSEEIADAPSAEGILPSPLPIEVSTETKMNELLATAPVGAVYKYVGTTTDTYENGGIYLVEVSE